MREIANELGRVVDEAACDLRQIFEDEASKPILPGGWSRKQVIGHLIDSASNNHQRFVRAALDGGVDFPDYDQVGWVRIGASQNAPWPMLLDVWSAMNRLLSHVLAYLPEKAAGAPCRIGEGEPVPLRTLVDQYLNHMRHHLDQIL
jgi:hypothetical protein